MSQSFYSLKVSKIIQETPDTVSLAFEIPESLQSIFSYTQGQYLTLKFQLNGKEERRSYSMSSSPHETELSVTVKRVDKGLVSNYIHDQIKQGDEIEVLPPEGRFFTKLDVEQRKSYYLFAAGSGITPIISILKAVLEQEPQSTVFLLYGNRQEEGIIFKNQLDELVKKYSGQVYVEHMLSQPKKEKASGLSGFFKKAKSNWAGKTGRIDAAAIKLFLTQNPPRNKDCEYFICGPGAMITAVENALANHAIDKKHIHAEHFTANPEDIDQSVAEKVVGEAQVTVHLDGESLNISVPKNKTILEVLLDQKAEPPYSCNSGSCSTCMAKVIKGEVAMEVCHALDEDEIEEGFILTCQSHPTTAEVEITFDV